MKKYLFDHRIGFLCLLAILPLTASLASTDEESKEDKPYETQNDDQEPLQDSFVQLSPTIMPYESLKKDQDDATPQKADLSNLYPIPTPGGGSPKSDSETNDGILQFHEVEPLMLAKRKRPQKPTTEDIYPTEQNDLTFKTKLKYPVLTVSASATGCVAIYLVVTNNRQGKNKQDPRMPYPTQ